MEARFSRFVAPMGALVVGAFASVLSVAPLLAASHRTANFIVSAPTSELAREFGEAAETLRRDLAIQWLDRELPRWPEPCPIACQVGEPLGAGGATTFVFDRDGGGQMQVYGWRMTVQGSRQRILDSVLPHEITHTVFATHFRRPLPRWADEGGSTTVEHVSETSKQQAWLISFLKTGRGIPFDRMFAMKEYPRDIMPLYAQGYSTAQFLIAQKGRREFVKFIETGFRAEDWPAAVRQHYGYGDLEALQNEWLAWVRGGSRDRAAPRDAPNGSPPIVLAANGQPARPEGNRTLRGQSPDEARSDAVATASHATGNNATGNNATGNNATGNNATADDAPSRFHPVRRSRSDDEPSTSSIAASAPAPDGGSASRPAASRTSGGGWYARGQKVAKPRDEVAATDPRSPSHAAAEPRSATRPQDVEKSRQIILEWDRSEAAVAGAAALDASLSRPGTVRR